MIPYLLFIKYLAYMNLASDAMSANQFSDHCFIMKSEAQLPFCNRVCATPDITDDEIQKVLEHFGTTPFRWFVEQTDSKQSKMIQRHGFEKIINYPAMITDLSAVKPTEYSTDVIVKEISPTNEGSLWVNIVARSYANGQITMNESEFLKFIQYLVAHTPAGNIKLYCGYYQGKPAATSMFIRHGNVAGIHWVGTLPEYRGKGLGFAISHKPLIDAQKLGCSQAILLATDMGRPVYEKIGFREYARYDVYGRV